MTAPDWSPGARQTVPDLIRRRLEHDPQGAFLDLDGKTWSAGEVFTFADRLACSLLTLGARPGDRVAILMENCVEAVVALYAALRTGIIAVPVNTAHKGEYLRHQLADSGASILLTDAAFASRVREVEGRVPELRHVIVTGAARPTGDWLAWADVLETGDPLDAPEPGPRDACLLIYTGGTTGPSKACVISHNYAVALARQTSEMWGRHSDDVFWTPLPLFHFNAVALVLVGTLLVGGRAALSRRFSVSRFWEEISAVDATMASTLGSMVTLVANDSVRPHSPDSTTEQANRSLRFVCGAPISPAVVDAWVSRFSIRPFDAAYGLTEGSLMAWLPPGMTNKPNVAGVANDRYWDLRIFDDDDNEVPPDVPGEIVGRPKQPDVAFDGYWRRPADTLAALRNLWLHTGDVGRIDADGYLYFMDRKADYLRRRGENISSQELEHAFLAHPDIEDVAVVAVASPIGEDDIMICVEPRPGRSLGPESLFRWAVERVPYFALPRYIDFHESLPRSPMGKVLKGQLRDAGVSDHTWDVEASGIEYDRR